MTTDSPGGLLPRLASAHDAISFAGFMLGAGAIGLIVAIYAYEVTMRYFFVAPTMWASDFVSFLLLFSVFLVMPWLTREGGHVAVTLLPDMLPERLGSLLLRLGWIAGSAACLWAAWISLQENIVLFERGTATLTVVRFPKWALTAVITYGLLNSGLYFARLAIFPAAEVQGDGGRHA
ncbi:TRAP transporter small permease [Roseovarius sp. 10]|uniref:TRAP transporter small permease n=1 Tax=Roseovarius sp. 10 TaxID=3080563 RepID=UPI002955C87F|nr:TRAP transporter small permease [Roseovarius sp. 10]MDV7202345.1 TRAP transporter small permease [Roseovarius sp. 10]